MAATKQSIDIKALTSVCFDLAQTAGGIIREVFRGGQLNTKDKSSNGALTGAGHDADADDPQTIADVRSQKLIIGTLKKWCPNLTIIGEEGDVPFSDSDIKEPVENVAEIEEAKIPSNEVDLKDVVVWVDPLDGTKEFTNGVTEAVTVLIGIAVKGKAHAGVIHIPFSKRTVWGIVGSGAFGYKPVEAVQNRSIVTTTRHHITDRLKTLIAGLKPDEVIHVGGAGHKSLLVLEGRADAYVFPQSGTKKWDTCAPDAVLHAAGGRLTDGFGAPLSYEATVQHQNSAGVLVTMRNHDKYVVSEISDYESTRKKRKSVSDSKPASL